MFRCRATPAADAIQRLRYTMRHYCCLLIDTEIRFAMAISLHMLLRHA